MAEFLNVYNFIPFPEEKREYYKEDCGEKHTGVITYTITTKTPLFIPNSSTMDAFQMEKKVPEHHSYDFYSYRDMEAGRNYMNEPAMPILPGSELRGMVRSIYETLTDSCMGVLNSGEIPVLRSGVMFKPGLLARKGKDRFAIEPAYACLYKEQDAPGGKTYLTKKFTEGQKVYVNPVCKEKDRYSTKECLDKPNDTCKTEGYFVKGMSDGSFNKKKAARAFVSKGGKEIFFHGEAVERLQKAIKSYQEQPTAEDNSYKEYEQQLQKFLNKEGNEKFPVYYSTAAQNGKILVYLSPACITKEVSNHTIGELANEMAPCNSSENRCPACDLFGRIGASHEDVTVSKIRFTDARPDEREHLGTYYDEIVTLPSLAEPKLGAVDFYLKKPSENALFWTYDYYVEKDSVHIHPGKLRGRKYYWHHPKMKAVKGLGKVEPTNLNKTIRPVKAEVTFTGKVYFDGISDRQLEQLKWILNGGTKDDALMYKLGSGKPLGLGSVKCQVKEVKERKLSLTADGISYEEISVDTEIRPYDDAQVAFSKSAKQAFFLMSDFHAVSKIADGKDIRISYPMTEEQAKSGEALTEGFKWFVENHKGKVKPRGHAIKNELPELRFDENGNLAGALVMPCHKAAQKNKSFSGKQGGKPYNKAGKKNEHKGGRK